MQQTTIRLTICLALFICAPLPLACTQISVASAAQNEWPALKLRKPAKLHSGPSASSPVIETVWGNAVCIWLDKQDVWVQVRMKKDSRIGWIHQSYLAPAVRSSSLR